MKMTTERRAAVAFAGVLLLAAAAVAGWFAWSSVRAAHYEIRTADSVSGLIAGAPVEFHGVEVGHVTRVALAGPGAVRIRIEVDRLAPVSTATVATVTGRGLAARGFTGYVYVSLEDRGPGGVPLRAAADGGPPVIAAAPSRLANLDTVVGEMNQAVQSAHALLRETLDPQTVAALQRTVRSVDQLAQTLAANGARLDAVIARAEAASRRLPPLVDRSAAVAETLQMQTLPRTLDTLAAIERTSTVVGGRMDDLLARTQQASEELQPLLASSHEVARTLQADILPQADRSLRRLERLSSTLDETAAGLRRDPSMLLRGPRAPALGPGEVQ